MSWIHEWQRLIGDSFEVCRCGHFRSKHHDSTGPCYGVDYDDHSIRCECREAEVLPPVACSQCGQSFVIHDRTRGFSHCDDHTEWEAE